MAQHIDINNNHEIYYLYLNELREFGGTNMCRANKNLQAEFGLESDRAKLLLAEWIALPMSYHNSTKAVVT
jgi:hypothetical protein